MEKIREKINRELRSGLYTLFILKSVETLGEAYGYEIIKHIEKKSGGMVKMKDATVYPVLRYLNKNRILHSFWAASEIGAPRKYYTLTEDGKKVLDMLLRDYRLLSKISKKILEGDKNE